MTTSDVHNGKLQNLQNAKMGLNVNFRLSRFGFFAACTVLWIGLGSEMMMAFSLAIPGII